MKLHERIIIPAISATATTQIIQCPVCKMDTLRVHTDDEADGAFQGTWSCFCENEDCKATFDGEIKTVELTRIS